MGNARTSFLTQPAGGRGQRYSPKGQDASLRRHVGNAGTVYAARGVQSHGCQKVATRALLLFAARDVQVDFTARIRNDFGQVNKLYKEELIHFVY